MTRRRTILFLNHSASRNGASLLLLHLLQWLRANTDFRLEVLSDGGGPLIDDFRAVAPTRVWRNPLFFLRGFAHPRAAALRSRLEATALRLSLRPRYDLVYANTAAAWSHVAALGSRRGALLWHIHELPYALGLTLADARARALLPEATRVVAVSGLVGSSLVDRFAVPEDRVDLVHGFVPIHDITADMRRLVRQRILGEIGWPEDAFVVGACGAPGWRKGSDLFLQIARRLHRSDARHALRFLWVGGDEADTEDRRFVHDLQALGLDAVCRRVASTANVDDYYCAMDAFALTSREDPFPLVMLEAAVHGLPTVCFDTSGGGPEFVAGGAGMAVPYLDLDAFASAIETLHSQPMWRRAFGAAAWRKVRQHHCIETQGPKLLGSIERCLAAA